MAFSLRLVALYFAAFGTFSALASDPAKLSHGRRSRNRRHGKRTACTPSGASSTSSGTSSTSSAPSSSPSSSPTTGPTANALFAASSSSAPSASGSLAEFDDSWGLWLSLSLGLGGGSSLPMPSSSSAVSVSSVSTPASTPSSTSGSSVSSTASSPASTSTGSTGTGSGSTLTNPGPTTSSTDKHVFAHFMIGICSTYVQSDYVNDMQLAMKAGITAFALNIGTDSYTVQQLTYAYAAAAELGFAVFISFDFNWYSTSDTSGVISILSQFAHESAQLTVDGKVFVSSFIGDGFNYPAVASGVGVELYAMPYWALDADDSGVTGLFSWYAWPGQPNNVPVNTSMTTDNDMQYINSLSGDSQQYMAPVSPWFFTHFGSEVSYSKNFLFKSETLWKDRWDQILQMGSANSLNFIEIITWNDYGESHYVGPYNTPHTDDGSSAWASGFDHTPMLTFAEPYIAAFRNGATAPVITSDSLTYWHRPHLKSASCDSTDICGSPPTGYEFVDDTVFVGLMTTDGGSFTVTSGSNAPVTETFAAGVQVFEIPMATGQQSFTLTTGAGSASTTSNITVSANCWNGIYNFNYQSGSITL